MSKFAPDKDGKHAYVVSRFTWGKTTESIKYAANLAEAKREFGYTRELHVHIKVRRATVADVMARAESSL